MNRDRAVLLVLLAIFLGLSALILLPFVQYVLLALLLAYVLYPVHERLAPRIGQRPSVVTLMVITVVLIVLPFVGLTALAIDQAGTVVQSIGQGPFEVATIEEAIRQYTGQSVDLAGWFATVDLSALVQSAGERETTALLGNVLQLVGGVSDALVGFAIGLFLLYYVLKDGDQFMAWVEGVSPLSTSFQAELYEEIDRVMWAVLVGNVFVAALQGVLTGVGLFAVGISNVVLWTLVTTVLSLLPLIGAFVVWFPAAVYLLAVGEVVRGSFLLVYGLTIVSLSDNYLRPLVVDRSAHLNPAVIILGLFGGVYAFGVMGLFFGPVVLGVLKTLFVQLARQREQVAFIEQ